MALISSSAVESIIEAGRMKPCLPLSVSSTVYAYLTPATPLAQSSDPPDARSVNKINYIKLTHLKFIFKCLFLSKNGSRCRPPCWVMGGVGKSLAAWVVGEGGVQRWSLGAGMGRFLRKMKMRGGEIRHGLIGGAWWGLGEWEKRGKRVEEEDKSFCEVRNTPTSRYN